LNVIITGEKGLGMSYIAFKNISLKELKELHPELVELRFTCLCGKFRCEKDMGKDKDYEMPDYKNFCKVCKEDLEWRIKEI
jgi:hypothetical protein